jgi:hypothetical protein
MDPLSVLGTAALTQAVTFLFGQVKDLLERRRARALSKAEAQVPLVTSGAGPGVLDAELVGTAVDPKALEEAASGLKVLQGALEDYQDGVKQVVPDDSELLGAVRGARDALEGLYGQRITFAGETGRPPTGTALSAEEVDARVATITASGKGAVAAYSISGPVATSGGMAAGSDINIGSRGDGSPSS